MCGDHDDSTLFSQAEWFARLSQSSKARGELERADHQLFLAWAAYEGVEVSPKLIEEKPPSSSLNIAAA